MLDRDTKQRNQTDTTVKAKARVPDSRQNHIKYHGLLLGYAEFFPLLILTPWSECRGQSVGVRLGSHTISTGHVPIPVKAQSYKCDVCSSVPELEEVLDVVPED